jgi:hypothetical protein
VPDTLKLGNIEVRRKSNGDLLIRHPSGVEVLETAEQQAAMRTALVDAIARATERLAEHNALCLKLQALKADDSGDTVEDLPA